MNQERHQLLLPSVSQCHRHSPYFGEHLDAVGMLHAMQLTVEHAVAEQASA